MKEIWKDYIYNYQISNFGRIRNKVTNKILKTRINAEGYLCVCVSLGKRHSCKMVKIHRAVAECFIPNPNNYPVVNHIDGNKENNLYSNLEWCTYQDNTLHAIKMGLITYCFGKDNKQSRPVEQLDLNGNLLNTFNSVTEAALSLGNYNYIPNITRVCNGIRKSACGYLWKYK